MESSRDSGWRHDAGRLVQFCACRKPTITICRAMFGLLLGELMPSRRGRGQQTRRHPEEAVRSTAVSKDGHTHGARFHPSRRPALRPELLRMTSVFVTRSLRMIAVFVARHVNSSSAAKPYSAARARNLFQV